MVITAKKKKNSGILPVEEKKKIIKERKLRSVTVFKIRLYLV